MVRWKAPRRGRRRRGVEEGVDYNLEESSRDHDEESEEEETEDDSCSSRIRFDGEHEDNYRDPMIRMGYFSLALCSILFHPATVALSIWLELSVCRAKSEYLECEKEKKAVGLLSPPMSIILENKSKFKEEIKFLKECNTRLTSSTLINAGLEVLALSYTLLIVLILKDIRYTYPLFQCLFHFIIRCNYKNLYRNPHVTPRFHAPADIVLAITVDLALSLVNWSKIEGPFSFLCVFRPCPPDLLCIPLLLSVLQIFARAQHSYLYRAERLMRKHIREKYNEYVAFMNFH